MEYSNNNSVQHNNTEKFCPNCGTPLIEGTRFCGGCGAKRPDTSRLPVQKKKSKALFIIGGGVVAAVLVVVLIFTNVFGLMNRTDGGNKELPGDGDANNGNGTVTGDANNANGSVNGDDEDSYYYFDWETIEFFGGVEGFAEWLRYGLELYAEDYYATVYGEYFMSPVEKVDIERGWLDGYPAAND